jgi:hypothetical protein
VYAALDRVAAHLDDTAQPLPGNAVLETTPAATLTPQALAIPELR